MRTPATLPLLLAALVLPALAQPKLYPLDSPAGLRLHNVQAASSTHLGKPALALTVSEDARRATAQLPIDQQAAQFEKLAVIEGLDFSDGVIEAEIAGAPQAGAPAGARGFVGIAFRLQPDLKTYDALYIRPTNGRADDQVRRNHSVQYIAHPDYPFNRLRREAPERYESYADLVPGAWTPIRIEVYGDKARLFVHGQPQPTLVVNDLKSGPHGRGAIALWIDAGTEAHFRNLRVTPAYHLDAGQDLSPAARQALLSILAKGYPGLAVLTAKAGKEITRLSAGPLDANTLRPIASASKWLTAATVLHLVDEGLLSLDKPISTWLPAATPAIGQLTLRQLLAQTSGIPNARNAALTPQMTLAQATRAIGDVPLSHTPGSTFVYGGPGFQIAGAVVEAATGASWEEVFQSRLARPLGMKNTRWAYLDLSTGLPRLDPTSRNPILQGGAESTATDYMRFLEMLAGGGRFRGQTILSPQSVEALLSDQTLHSTITPTGAPVLPNAHYALGNWCEQWNPNSAACTRNSSLGAWGVYPWLDRASGVYSIFFAFEPNDAFRVWPQYETLRNALIESAR